MMIEMISGYSGDIEFFVGFIAFGSLTALMGFSSARGCVMHADKCIPIGGTYEIVSECLDNNSKNHAPRRAFIARDRNGRLLSFWLEIEKEPERFIFIDTEDGMRLIVPRDPRDVIRVNSIPYL